MRVRLIPGDGTSAIPLRKSATTVGRARALCDLVLESKAVSKRHCELRVEHRRLVVRDLGSRNGTWINGRRISEAELQPGDELKISQVVFRVEMDSPERSSQADTDAHGQSAPHAAKEPGLQEEDDVCAGLPDGDWFVRMGGQDRGPLSVDELQELADKQVIGPFSLLKCGTESEWYPAQMIAKALFVADSCGSAAATVPRPHSLGHSVTRRVGGSDVRPFRPPATASALDENPSVAQHAMGSSHERVVSLRATEPDEASPFDCPPLVESIPIPDSEPQTVTSAAPFPSGRPEIESEVVMEEAFAKDSVTEDVVVKDARTREDGTEADVLVPRRAKELAQLTAALTEAVNSPNSQPQPVGVASGPNAVAKVSRILQSFSLPSTPDWFRKIDVTGAIYHPASRVVVAAVLVLLAFCWILSGSDETTYDTLQAVYEELQAKRGGNTSQVDWSEFKTRAEDRLDALIADLDATASSQEPIKQDLLWAGGDLRKYMLVRNESSRSRTAEGRFLVRMREARAAMDGEPAKHPRVVQNDRGPGRATDLPSAAELDAL